MKHKSLSAAIGVACAVLFCGCASLSLPLFSRTTSYSPSGTIILSRTLAPGEQRIGTPVYAPLLGYVPPVSAFVPAQNETWMHLNKKNRTIAIYKGKTKVKEILGEGEINLDPGVYSLQYKQKDPSWYAPDDYFVKRRLNVPPAGDSLRFRKGALGQYAIYPTSTFAIHSGPVWTRDVGGLRVSRSDLSAVYYLLPLGASVKVE